MEAALQDLVRELAQFRLRVDDLEVEIEIVDEVMLDPWFERSEAVFAAIEDDPTAQIHVIAPLQLRYLH